RLPPLLRRGPMRPPQVPQRRRLPLPFPTATRCRTLHAAVAPAGEHDRIDVGLAAHRRRVAQRGGDLAHDGVLNGGQRTLARRFASCRHRQAGAGQTLERRQRAAPGAEVLRTELAARGLVQVGVDLARLHRGQLAVVVAILEQRLPGELLATPQQPHQARVVEDDVVVLPALAAEAETGAATAQELDMAVAQRSQAEGTVVARVFGVADPDQGLAHDRHYHRHYLLARKARARQVGAQAPAQLRQCLAERDDAIELALAAHLAPARVVAVLLATARIASGGLDVPARIGT